MILLISSQFFPHRDRWGTRPSDTCGQCWLWVRDVTTSELPPSIQQTSCHCCMSMCLSQTNNTLAKNKIPTKYHNLTYLKQITCATVEHSNLFVFRFRSFTPIRRLIDCVQRSLSITGNCLLLKSMSLLRECGDVSNPKQVYMTFTFCSFYTSGSS